MIYDNSQDNSFLIINLSHHGSALAKIIIVVAALETKVSSGLVFASRSKRSRKPCWLASLWPQTAPVAYPIVLWRLSANKKKPALPAASQMFATSLLGQQQEEEEGSGQGSGLLVETLVETFRKTLPPGSATKI